MGLYSNRVFPRLIDFAMSSKAFSRVRSDVLSGAEGRILEIGFGTGLNLPHYPPSVEAITVIDPNEGMNTRAARRIGESSIKVDQRRLSGESLDLDDESFDTVVCTWTLCSIPDVNRALGEVRRVLKPGGRFLFAEHGLCDDPKVQRWQNRLTPLQKVIGDGCHLNRDIRAIVGGQGFAFESFKNFCLPKTPRMFGYMYQGIAVKS